jgi:TonB-dependent SusC/RagA subfamily outer membrane receptor
VLSGPEAAFLSFIPFCAYVIRLKAASFQKISAMHRKMSLFFIALTATIKIFAADGITVSAGIKNVTIYRSGAEMTHTASAVLVRGTNEVIVQGISNAVDAASIQVNCPSTVTVLGLEFSNNYLAPTEVSPRIQFLKDSLESLERIFNKLAVSISTTKELIEVLKANREIKGSQTGLSVAELMKLMEYYKTKSAELQNELAALQEKQKKVSAETAKIRAQIGEEEKRGAGSSGRITLQLSAALAGKADFIISYITPNAYWKPFYDVRVTDTKSPLKLIYKAKMVQTTGFDWKGVKLALSTSMPSQWGSAPVLQSWFLSYINPIVKMERNLMQNRIQSFDEKSLRGKVAGVQLDDVVVTGYGANIKIRGAASANADAKPLYIVNGTEMSESDYSRIDPSSIKSINVLKDANATAVYGARGANGVVLITLKDGLEDYISVTDNELNVTFDVELPYDIPTNGKEQTATLKEYDVAAQYKYYAVPKLDKDAYLLAEVPDWESLNLLPGEANIIFEGTYVGKSFIDPASTADTLNLTLGHDKRVVIKREKLVDYSSVKFLGSNKLQKMTYELTVKNNKKDAVRLLLKDQYPLSTNKDIEAELVESGDAAVNSELGVLTWKIDLAPGESKKVRFSYTVKYPKDKVVNLN